MMKEQVNYLIIWPSMYDAVLWIGLHFCPVLASNSKSGNLKAQQKIMEGSN